MPAKAAAPAESVRSLLRGLDRLDLSDRLLLVLQARQDRFELRDLPLEALALAREDLVEVVDPALELARALVERAVLAGHDPADGVNQLCNARLDGDAHAAAGRAGDGDRTELGARDRVRARGGREAKVAQNL